MLGSPPPVIIDNEIWLTLMYFKTILDPLPSFQKIFEGDALKNRFILPPLGFDGEENRFQKGEFRRIVNFTLANK